MAEYRAYFVGNDGHFDGFEPLVCDCDDDAVAKVYQLLRDGKDIELWSGARLVIRLRASKKPVQPLVKSETDD